MLMIGKLEKYIGHTIVPKKNKKISVFFLLFLLLFIKISIQPFPLSIAPFFQKKCKKPPSADFSCFSKR